MAPTRARDGGQEFADGGVGEMSVPAADALLRAPRAFRVGLQHVRAVIGLDDQDVHFANVFAHMRGCVAEISKPGEAATRRE